MPEPVNDECAAHVTYEAASCRFLCCTRPEGHDGDHHDPIDGYWRIEVARLADAEATP